MENSQTVDTTEIELSIPSLSIRVWIKLITLQAIVCSEVSEVFCFGIEARDAKIRAHPQIALIILQNAVHKAVGQSVFFQIKSETIGFRMVKI